MEQLCTELRLWVVGIVSAMAAFLSPISGDVYSMIFLFAANALFGLIADIAIGRPWQLRKLWQAFKHAALFFGFVFFIYGIGTLKDNMTGAQQCVSFVVYSLIYFYGTNVCRNLCIITHQGSTAHAVFKWFYWILSVEFIKRLPYLKDYLGGKQPHEVDTTTPDNP